MNTKFNKYPNRMRRFILPVILLLSTMVVSSQDIVFNQHLFFKDNINPSSFLIANDVNIFALYNSNYGGFVEHPTTQIVDASFLLNDYKLGFFVENDNVGYDKIQNVKFRYAKKFQVSNISSFSLGIAAGIVHRSLEVTKLIFDRPNDPLSYSNYSNTVFDYDLGAEFQYERFYAGLSVTHLGQYFSSTNEALTGHMYGYLQYAYRLNNDFTFYPNVLFRKWKGSFLFEVGVTAFLRNDFWFGASYSDFQDMTVSGGLRIKKDIMFGYAYKTNFNAQILNPFVSSTHEVFVNFAIHKKYHNIKTPRFID